jgi:archaellum component FlaF (FlaF/FlaG flagellin family)
MGFSLVGAFAILSVTLMVALEIFSGNILPAVTNVNYAFKDLKDRSVETAHTNITISNISTTANGSNYDLNITIYNGGSITSAVRDFTVLINGTAVIFSSSRLFLFPKNTVYLNIYNLVGEGSRDLKVISANGVSTYDQYIVSV